MPANAKHVVTAFVDVVLNGGDISKIEEFVAETLVDHHPWPGHPGTREGFKSGLMDLRTAFPNMRCTIDHIDVEDDIVSVLVTRTGTHLGPLNGVEPSGNPFRVQILEMLRVESGRIVERWGFLEDVP